MTRSRLQWTPSLLALVLANAVPLVGALFFGWSVGAILGLYWAESAIVGGYTIVKMALWKPPEGNARAVTPTPFLIAFFVVHFGLFMLVHGFFVLLIAGAAEYGDANAPEGGPFAIAGEMIAMLAGAWLALLALVVSHGISFFTNYLAKEEGKKLTQHQLMSQPYARILVMHVTLLAGCLVTLVLGAPPLVVAILIVLKTIADARQHQRERPRALAEQAVLRD